MIQKNNPDDTQRPLPPLHGDGRDAFGGGESTGQGTPDKSPELNCVRSASFDEVRNNILTAVPGHVTHVATIWGTPSFNQDPSRAAMRPDKGTFRGTFTDGNDRMPYVGFWLSGPSNRTFLLESNDITLDHSLISWFKEAGIGGEWVGVRNVSEMVAHLKSINGRLYSCDNYGTSIDAVTVNSRDDFDLVSNKSWTTRLVGKFAPYEERVNMFETVLSEELFQRVLGNSDTVYVKLCNEEHGGMGVKPVSSYLGFLNLVNAHKQHTQENELNPELVLQRGIRGQNRSLCFFQKPGNTTPSVLSLTDQMTDPSTGRDLGNRHYALTDDNLAPVAGLVQELSRNISTLCPQAFGLVMCDFIHTPSGEVFAIDPGLRPSASSPSAMAQLWVGDALKGEAYVRNNNCFRFAPGFSWGDFANCLGSLTDPAAIRRTGVGIVPFSWEPRYGTGRVITLSRTEQEHAALIADVRKRVGAALLS
jgi:hypothetical protein